MGKPLRVLIIEDSEDDTLLLLRELKRRERKGVVAVAFEGPDGWLDGPEVIRREAAPEGARLILQEGADHQAILRRGVASGAVIHRFELLEPRLHEIFVRTVDSREAARAGP